MCKGHDGNDLTSSRRVLGCRLSTIVKACQVIQPRTSGVVSRSAVGTMARSQKGKCAMGSSRRDTLGATLDSSLSRRRFLGASVGAAAVFAAGSNLALRQGIYARQDDTRPV